MPHTKRLGSNRHPILVALLGLLQQGKQQISLSDRGGPEVGDAEISL